jgi:signal transduction histidine kinase
MTERASSPIGDIYVQVIQSRADEQRTLDSILRVLLFGGAVVVLVSVAFGAVYARRALVPIRESLTAQRAALRRQREFAADASHELRTPLTVIRARSSTSAATPTETAATAEALDDIDAEVGHLTALVEDLLLLARLTPARST